MPSSDPVPRHVHGAAHGNSSRFTITASRLRSRVESVSTAITTEVMVAEAPKNDEHMHPMPDMGGMGM